MPDVNPAPDEEEVINPGEQDDSDLGNEPEDQADQNVDNEDESKEEEADDSEADAEEKSKPSRRESLRIQKLVSKLREQHGADVEPPKAEKPKGALDYRTALDADDEVINQLEQDRTSYGTAQYREGLKQAQSMQFHTRLELDSPRVDSKYPLFDKESPDFKPNVASAVNEWYLATAGYDPKTNMVENANVRYLDFVDGIMELANEIAGEKVASTRRTITRQAATTGLRPDGSSPKRLNLNQPPEKMSDEELDAIIAQAIPRR